MPAIDIDPTVIKWVRGVDRKLNDGLYFDPRVEVDVGESRHAVRSASWRYEVTENLVCTKEAVLDDHRSLSDQGMLSISRWLFSFHPPRSRLPASPTRATTW